MARALRVAFAVGAGLVVACGAIAGIDDYVIGPCKGGICTPEGGDSGDAGGPVQPDDSGVPCKGTGAPVGIRIGAPGNTFCIDATEVANFQYREFLAAGVPVSSQPANCAWNTSFEPDPSDAGPTLPVVGVDWCDALAYCSWAGKYLCGTVENGKKVGPVTVEGASDFRSHQWLLACSAEARLKYPYGSSYARGVCNLADYDAGRPVGVATATECVGGYTGVYDLIGNVWEWYDGPCARDGTLEVDGGDGGPQSDNCWIKGASYADVGAAYDCRLDLPNIRRDHHGPNVGFRCCSN